MNLIKRLIVLLFFGGLIVSCSTQQKLSKEAKADFFTNADFAPAHLGISVFDPSSSKYLYNYQGDKLFIPASNTKLFSCYAAMKYLGDSIVAARYKVEGNTVILHATGDPTFLHPDFKNQRLYQFLKQDWVQDIEINTKFNSEALGRGWAWDDYTAEYMAERDPFPMYGNVATFIFSGDTLRTIPQSLRQAIVGNPELNKAWTVDRNLGGRFFTIVNGRGTNAMQKSITMSMDKGAFAARYLSDTLHKKVAPSFEALTPAESKKFYSQPLDSMLRIMMHRSDNFFAEQTLMMVGSEWLGIMSDRRVTDSLLNSDLKELPQKPKWVDGSGLSRYNLFSPQDFVWLLNKMEKEFGIERMKDILPTGGEGTLSSLYKSHAGRIFAKTGTLSNHVALSGYIFTKKNKMLIFSVLANNQLAASGNIRKSIEKFVTSLIDNY
jgi:D-alanyl-D-alanine carboxypeptidase/D-alanyl-D-alanine-endopeptidase (penicillin-binding protein 4)